MPVSTSSITSSASAATSKTIATANLQHQNNHHTVVTNNDDSQQHPQQQQQHESQQLRLYTSFDDMPLHNDLLRGIYSYGFEKPSDIQQRAIVPIAKGGDVIAQASAGSGKTGAFVTGFLARMDPRLCRTQVLVLSPTRELSLQTHEVTLGIGSRLFADLLDAGATPVALLSSNIPVRDNMALLQNVTSKGNAQVAVGTPGRILQLLEKGILRPEHLRTLVIDEADELFSQGFQEQLSKILAFLPRDIQAVLVSATLPDEVRAIADRFMRNPTRILLRPKEIPVEAIRQFRVDGLDGADDKMMVLMDLYERISISQSIIFVNSRRKAEYVAKEMNAQGFAVSLTHGDLGRGERDAVIARFRKGETRVLVSTDLVGRGIDVYHVNLVINFELPVVAEKYIHRVGRCGRYGRKGAAINLISAREDLPLMQEIERAFGIKTSPLPADFTKLICEE